jgi:hypothetical protein
MFVEDDSIRANARVTVNHRLSQAPSLSWLGNFNANNYNSLMWEGASNAEKVREVVLKIMCNKQLTKAVMYIVITAAEW